jgi:hypothetical protein
LLALGGCQARGKGGTVTLAQDDAGLADLWFMTGRWSTMPNSGNRVEEYWTTASAGTLLGMSRTIESGKTIFFEYVRVERTPDGIFYFASPGGEGQTAFRLVESGGGRAVFENPEHDFPTRITYERLEDGRLHAWIEGEQRGRVRSEHWFYRPVRLAGRRE